jgi:polar amino acid transport system substrate-binding protein
MKRRVVAAVAAAGLTLTACSASGGSGSESSGAPGTASCAKADLQTQTQGTLTIATGEPAYEPWVSDDKPETGEGFEAAVAHAAAEKLGFGKDEVTWIRTTFEGAIAPGPKDFDWNIQQFSITEDREKAVDFSSPYYDVNQAVIAGKDSPIAGATSIADLKSAKLGASVGSTSLDAAQATIAPSTDVSVFNDNPAAVSALKNGQIDGIVVDLPTAFYLVAAEIDDGVIVGQLPATEGETTDQFGILLANGSPLTACTSQAVDQLRADGTLDQLAEKWLGTEAGAPSLG